jgi:hypothetical protein
MRGGLRIGKDVKGSDCALLNVLERQFLGVAEENHSRDSRAPSSSQIRSKGSKQLSNTYRRYGAPHVLDTGMRAVSVTMKDPHTIFHRFQFNVNL